MGLLLKIESYSPFLMQWLLWIRETCWVPTLDRESQATSSKDPEKRRYMFNFMLPPHPFLYSSNQVDGRQAENRNVPRQGNGCSPLLMLHERWSKCSFPKVFRSFCGLCQVVFWYIAIWCCGRYHTSSTKHRGICDVRFRVCLPVLPVGAPKWYFSGQRETGHDSRGNCRQKLTRFGNSRSRSWQWWRR